MDTDSKGNAPSRSDNANLGRSQAVFIIVGVTIVIGGLWQLYSGSGPYHP